MIAAAVLALALGAAAPADSSADAIARLEALAREDAARGDLDAVVERWTAIHARRAAAHGEASAEAAQALHTLGWAQRNAGRYRDALATLRETLALRERLLGADHADVAWTLNNLANVHFDLGDFAETRRLHGRALAIRERLHGPDHADVALSLNNLANAIERAGDPAAAAPLHERALAIRERVHGPWDRRVAQSLNNLGLAYMELGELERAKPLYERSIAIRDSALGPGSEEAARTRLRLGLLLLRMDRPAEAARVLEAAVEANRRALGEAHPLGADAEIALACARLREGRDDEALALALHAETRTRSQLRLVAEGLDEEQAMTYAGARSSGIDVALTLAAAAPDDTARIARVWDALARSRAVVLDGLIARRRVAAAARDTATARRRAAVAAARDRHAMLALSGSASAADLERSGEAKRAAERALAAHSLSFRRELAGAEATLADVRAALGRDEALVTLAWHRALPRAGRRDTTLEVLALVAGPGGAAPRAVRLGAAAGVDAAIRAWRAAIARPPHPLRRARDEAAAAAAGRALAARLWDPLASRLAGAARVFVVPEGDLAFVPLGALPDPSGRPLVESGPLLHRLATERDLAAPRSAATGRGLLVLGGPAFGGAAPARARASDAPCAVLAGGGFDPLPGAAAEAAEVARAWDAGLGAAASADDRAVALTGAAARERALRERAGAARALHVASHGFFLPARCPGEPVDAARAPLLRGGLALAGANDRGAGADPTDDGVLTAAEIAGLDLEPLEWVVLSACETGLGEADVHEGVLGLRRAFRAAGARALVMSLWRVEDAAARAWMRALYAAHGVGGRDGAAAARDATRAVLRARRAANESLHPYHWAAFVFEGDDRRE